jgi:hypothetical protein
VYDIHPCTSPCVSNALSRLTMCLSSGMKPIHCWHSVSSSAGTCLPTPLPPPPHPSIPGTKAVAAWGQCGGMGAPCGQSGSGPCVDSAWSGYACDSGYSCQRSDQWWWACKPGGTPATTAVGESDKVYRTAIAKCTMKSKHVYKGACQGRVSMLIYTYLLVVQNTKHKILLYLCCGW